ncbi:MAG: AbrB/MazE/SpoVT family DNA-binding domain-containing protein [Thermofilaceae archaeon]|nr:AbrB/MazE/SpoVT family DNA-binding domain-containing protein [Thermofilaceae archaeon]MCX8179967.1 AbrB/MazE/SpoVT family DNA-binding domain-containing protein [Thermofilaceae archaeon]MDW8004728.1 AbrB/MazE/SpoVT family DNA-binding domain-containing protein [Thermofilaceae archaeon]
MRVKVTRNYQVTIPVEVREALGIREGDYVELELRDGYAVLKPLKRRWTTVKLGRDLKVEDIEEIADRAFSP